LTRSFVQKASIRVLNNKNPVVRQGARDFEKRSPANGGISKYIFEERAAQHDGLRRSFFNTRIEQT
jgi:hypothetical protein